MDVFGNGEARGQTWTFNTNKIEHVLVARLFLDHKVPERLSWSSQFRSVMDEYVGIASDVCSLPDAGIIGMELLSEYGRQKFLDGCRKRRDFGRILWDIVITGTIHIMYIRTKLDFPRHIECQMGAQAGQVGFRARVHQSLDAEVGPTIGIVMSARIMQLVSPRHKKIGDLVGVQTGGIEDALREHARALVRFGHEIDNEAFAGRCKAHEGCTETHVAALVQDALLEAIHQAVGVDNARRGRKQGGVGCDIGLERAGFLAGQETRLDAEAAGFFVKIDQVRFLVGRLGHHEFADSLVRNIMLLTKGIEHSVALDTQLRLETVGRVVDSCVNDFTVP